MKFFDTETFWGRVKQKAFDNGMSIKTLSEKIGEPYKSMTNRISNNTVPKKAGLIEAMAKELGCSPEYLTTGKESQTDHRYGPDLEAVIAAYKFLTDDKKKMVKIILEALGLMQEYENEDFKSRNPELFK